MLMCILLTVTLMRIETPRIGANIACEKIRMHIFSLYDLLLPEGDSVVSPDAGVVPGAGFIVVANGPEVVTPKIIQDHQRWRYITVTIGT